MRDLHIMTGYSVQTLAYVFLTGLPMVKFRNAAGLT